ncbi:hypothetical protein [Rhizohabitans arisaemae]|uniref:hypothetical protein n=1 Tax=Rhizohabitans arisaemae TaxID=2720610 RepID=UPI0024B0CB3F|nr:hypothetical protein [Rhizohabitans arisaemae]
MVKRLGLLGDQLLELLVPKKDADAMSCWWEPCGSSSIRQRYCCSRHTGVYCNPCS